MAHNSDSSNDPHIPPLSHVTQHIATSILVRATLSDGRRSTGKIDPRRPGVIVHPLQQFAYTWCETHGCDVTDRGSFHRAYGCRVVTRTGRR